MPYLVLSLITFAAFTAVCVSQIHAIDVWIICFCWVLSLGLTLVIALVFNDEIRKIFFDGKDEQ